MAGYNYNLNIINKNTTRLTIAANTSRLKTKILLIKKKTQLSGDYLHYKYIPNKTLIHTTQIYHLTQNIKHFNLPPIHLTPINFSHIKTKIHQIINTIQPHNSPKHFYSLKTIIKQKKPNFINKHLIILKSYHISNKF